mgnify:FL=1|jgi:hypothetical protein|tara:strand:+ start:1621 stop:2058 length:438 start_codon:yes stop_codon:yes gene_type:complete
MDSKEIDKLIEEIALIIKGYSSLDKDFKDIKRLIVAKRKLVGYAFRFSAVVGYALDQYNISYAIRKNELANKKLKYIEDGDSAGKAELKAELKNYQLRLAEGENEALYRRVKSYFDTMRDAITSITQDISILRKEYEDTRVHDNG